MTKMNDAKFATKAVWAGEKDYLVHGATQVPVIPSVAFGYDDMDEWYEVAVGRKKAIFMAVIQTRLCKRLKIK